MRFRRWIYRMLDRGHAPEPVDPERPMELENVWLHEGPMLLSVLEQAGVSAHGVESTSTEARGSASTRMRIFVRQAELQRATDAIAEHRRFLGRTD